MANKENRFLNYLNTLFARWGGSYINRALLFTFATSGLAALGSVINITTTIELSSTMINHLIKGIVVTIPIANILAFGVSQLQTKNLRKLTAMKSHGEDVADDSLEIKAWEELTALPWRFVFTAVVITFFFVIVPIVIYMQRVAGATENEIVHIFLGGLLTIVLILMVYLILLRILLAPVRQALLPQSFDGQLAGLSGLSIRTNMRLLSVSVVSIALLSVAPHGYQEAINAMTITGAGRAEIIQFRWQLILVAIVAVVIGIALADTFARTLYQPVERLRQAMEEISTGDLSERADAISTDEIGALAIYFNQMVAQLKGLQEGLEDRITKQTKLLRTTTEVGRVVSSILDSDLLITNVVSLITERLDYYYAAIFLVSHDGRWAVLQDATGEAGRTLKARKHRLDITGQNMVGAAIKSHEPRIALDVGKEAVRFENPLLPNTRSEIALPLIAGGHVLGALNVQSAEASAFDENTVETLQGMANQVAIALENAALFQETQQALQEIRAAQHQQLQDAWSQAIDDGGLEYTTGEAGVFVEGDKPATLLNVPMALRDQVIGEITLEGHEEWSEEDRDWVEAVATQAALALENARLLEDSQQIALQERLVAEISGKIWSSTTIETILQTTIRELGTTLGTTNATIELHVDDK